MVDIDFIVDELKKDQQKLNKLDNKNKSDNQTKSDNKTIDTNPANIDTGVEPRKKVTKTVTVTTSEEVHHDITDDNIVNTPKKVSDKVLTVIDAEEIKKLVKEAPTRRTVKKKKVNKISSKKKKMTPFRQTHTTKSAAVPKLKENISIVHVLNEMKELKSVIKDLTKLFKKAEEEIKKPDPVIDKLHEISEQNERIAEALLTVVDIVKESKKEIEEIEIPDSELPEFRGGEEPPVPMPPGYMNFGNPYSKQQYSQNSPPQPPYPDDSADQGQLRDTLEPLNSRPGKSGRRSLFDDNESQQRMSLKPIKTHVPPPPLNGK